MQCWEADTSLWVPQLRELLPSALWELNSSKWKRRIWICEQCLPGKAFDLPWVSQQEEFSGLELLPSSDHGTLNFCSAVLFLSLYSLFPLTVLWLPRGLKPLWWWGIQRFSCLWLRVPEGLVLLVLLVTCHSPGLNDSEGSVTRGIKLSNWVCWDLSVLINYPRFLHSLGSFCSTCHYPPRARGGSFHLCMLKCWWSLFNWRQIWSCPKSCHCLSCLSPTPFSFNSSCWEPGCAQSLWLQMLASKLTCLSLISGTTSTLQFLTHQSTSS